MLSRRIATLAVFLSISWASAHAHHLAVVTHPHNTASGVTSAELAKIFKSEMKSWPDGHDITVVLNRNSVSSMHILERLAGMAEGKTQAFFAAHKGFFVLADSDAEVLDYVASKPGAMGLLDVHDVDDRVKVIKVDGKLPLEKAYLPH
jgi:ABC-type phosphate transport system substrate-binding protein